MNSLSDCCSNLREIVNISAGKTSKASTTKAVAKKLHNFCFWITWIVLVFCLFCKFAVFCCLVAILLSLATPRRVRPMLLVTGNVVLGNYCSLGEESLIGLVFIHWFVDLLFINFIRRDFLNLSSMHVWSGFSVLLDTMVTGLEWPLYTRWWLPLRLLQHLSLFLLSDPMGFFCYLLQCYYHAD